MSDNEIDYKQWKNIAKCIIDRFSHFDRAYQLLDQRITNVSQQLQEKEQVLAAQIVECKDSSLKQTTALAKSIEELENTIGVKVTKNYKEFLDKSDYFEEKIEWIRRYAEQQTLDMAQKLKNYDDIDTYRIYVEKRVTEFVNDMMQTKHKIGSQVQDIEILLQKALGVTTRNDVLNFNLSNNITTEVQDYLIKNGIAREIKELKESNYHNNSGITNLDSKLTEITQNIDKFGQQTSTINDAIMQLERSIAEKQNSTTFEQKVKDSDNKLIEIEKKINDISNANTGKIKEIESIIQSNYSKLETNINEKYNEKGNEKEKVNEKINERLNTLETYTVSHQNDIKELNNAIKSLSNKNNPNVTIEPSKQNSQEKPADITPLKDSAAQSELVKKLDNIESKCLNTITELEKKIVAQYHSEIDAISNRLATVESKASLSKVNPQYGKEQNVLPIKGNESVVQLLPQQSESVDDKINTLKQYFEDYIQKKLNEIENAQRILSESKVETYDPMAHSFDAGLVKQNSEKIANIEGIMHGMQKSIHELTMFKNSPPISQIQTKMKDVDGKTKEIEIKLATLEVQLKNVSKASIHSPTNASKPSPSQNAFVEESKSNIYTSNNSVIGSPNKSRQECNSSFENKFPLKIDTKPVKKGEETIIKLPSLPKTQIKPLISETYVTPKTIEMMMPKPEHKIIEVKFEELEGFNQKK